MFDFTDEKNIRRLQSNLLVLRTVAGWNAEEFSKRIGISRQYYSELENGTRKLTYSLYLAILYVFEKEGHDNKELLKVLETCLNDKEISLDKCHELSKYISSERKKNTRADDANKKLLGILGTTAAITAIVAIIVKSITKK